MSRQHRRPAVAVAAIMGAALLMTGCGSGTPGEPASGDDATTADGGETVEIDFWQRQFTDPEDAWYKATVDAYNASQDGVHVNLQLIPADAWEQKMKAAQAAGKAPDLYTLTINNVPLAVRQGQVAPISDYVGSEPFADLTDMALQDVTVDGKQYAYPMLYEPQRVLYYRTDLFEAAGLEGAPTTWDDLLSYGQQLTTDGVFGLLDAQDGPTFGWSSWGLQWSAADHLPISDDWSEARADDQAYEPLLQLFQDLQSTGVLPRQPLGAYPDATPFGEGKAAMMANGSWAMSQILNDYPEMADNIAVAPYPTQDGDLEKTTSGLGGWKWVVDAKSDNPQEASDFVAWALGGDPENLLDYFRTTQFSKFSARTSVTAAIDADAEAAENPWRRVISDQIMPFAKPEPTYDWTISEAFGLAMEKVQKGEAPAVALAEAQARITEIIEENSLAGQGTS